VSEPKHGEVKPLAIHHIVAASKNWIIGLDGKMPWHISEDLKYFKRMTLGCPVIMGRKTFESMGKPLPGRFNVVLSRSDFPLPEGTALAHSLDEAISLAQTWYDEHPAPGEPNIFIIGGGDLYRSSVQRVQRIYLTAIERVIEGDTFYPPIDEKEFKLLKSERHELPEAFSFKVYERSLSH
jgi:dihydrofolate reductase